jgi:hypothetical protein
MNKRFAVALAALMLVAGAGAARAQEAPKPPEGVKSDTAVIIIPLKIQVAFSEFDGEKKINSLPYTLNQNAEMPSGRDGTRTSLRMGIRVPIVTGGKEGQGTQVQYQNVGTDIDCRVRVLPGGVFQLRLDLRRSSVYTATPDAKQADWKPSDVISSQPFFREFSGAVDLLLKDGQTGQTTMATDPVTGRVLRVDVTLTIIK